MNSYLGSDSKRSVVFGLFLLYALRSICTQSSNPARTAGLWGLHVLSIRQHCSTALHCVLKRREPFSPQSLYSSAICLASTEDLLFQCGQIQAAWAVSFGTKAWGWTFFQDWISPPSTILTSCLLQMCTLMSNWPNHSWPCERKQKLTDCYWETSTHGTI